MEADYSVGYALNALYGGTDLSTQLPYWFFTPRDLGGPIPDYRPGLGIDFSLRNLQFQGNTSNAVAIIFHPAGSCLRILNPDYAGDPILNTAATQLLPLSNTSQIIEEGTDGSVRSNILGSEPAHTWCYYYQKSDLARQLGDWKTVVALMNEAQGKGLAPKDGSEWMPWMEAKVQTGQWQQAFEISQQAQQKTAGLDPFLCNQWKRYSALATSAGQSGIVAQANSAFHCLSGG
jgi:hypothetical protein